MIVSREGGRLRIKGALKGAAIIGYIDPTTCLRKPGFIDPIINSRGRWVVGWDRAWAAGAG